MHNRLKTWLHAGVGQKILLLRHGDIGAAKAEKRFIGQLDLPLSDLGRRQAYCWRRCLAEVPLARIVASDLSRCMETALIIAADRPTEIEALTGLREIRLGQWDGLTFHQIRHNWPEAFRKREAALARFRPPAGESFLDLQQRVIPVFEQTVEKTFGQGDRQGCGGLLIVAHAGVNRTLLCHLLGMPVDHLFRIDQGYGALNLIDRLAHGYRIQALNLLPDSDSDD